MALEPLARLALAAILAVTTAGCTLVADPGVRGSCELEVRTWDGRTDEILEPPYETALYVRPSGVQEVPITLRGTGWGTTHIDFAGPGKSLSTTFEAEVMNGDSSWFAIASGTWHFRLTDGVCAQQFDVEVRPAP